MEHYLDSGTGTAPMSGDLTLQPALVTAASAQAVDVPAMVAEIEALRRQVAHLQRELVEARATVQASEAGHLGRTLLIYVLDVLCALFRPQRGQALVVDTAAGILKEGSELHTAVGPLQMALERPGLQCAIAGRASRATTHYESVMWLPIIHGSNVAVILCLRRSAANPFSIEDELLGEVLGPLVISALQTNHRTYELHEDHEALRTLDTGLAVCIRMAGGRVTAMADDCRRLAQIFDLPSSDREAIRLGTILHDIGTVDLAEELLHKQGPLSAEEIAQIREHTSFGAAILRQVPGMEPIIPLIVHHHERWDGAGYPSGLAGPAIPLGARIVAVVDAFHAVTSPRSYRPARSVEEALAELERSAGGQFDPSIVKEYVQLVHQGR